MFTLYHSNQLDIHKTLLASILKADPEANPFIKEQILVQSPGMAQWLKIELAKEISICANIEFPLPASFIWQIFVDCLDDIPEKSAFNKDAMAWYIISLLPDLVKTQPFQQLANYLEEDDLLKTYQLAYKIADIFDQYLVYRPEWIAAWEKGENDPCEEDEIWQPILWRALVQTIHDSGQSHYHRANLYEHLIQRLPQAAANNKLPKRLFIFGIAAMPPHYLRALQTLSEYCDVHFFFTNPCQLYWGDILDRKWMAALASRQRRKARLDKANIGGGDETTICCPENAEYSDDGELISGNPILASMGKLGRDNLYLLSELNAQEIEAFIEPDADTLLSKLMADVFNLVDSSFIPLSKDDLESSSSLTTMANDDDSIVLHDCHSSMREVEVLYDQLLAMMDEDQTLKPKDIVVMVPDINSYSPYIQAVFSQQGKQHIDFSISDRSAEFESPMLLSFLKLLELPSLRCTSLEVFSLLEVPAIMENFTLNPKSLESIKQWISESGVRWGIGDEFENQHNSWQFGLQRLFKGYSQIEADDEPLWEGISSYDEALGMGAEPLGALAQFVDLLDQYSIKLQGEKDFSAWYEIIECMLHDFYGEEEHQELDLIRQTMKNWSEVINQAGFDQVLSQQVLQQHLQSKLTASSSSQRFLAGKLNFCTLMPMRSIPFKVVCLLGMNDGAYPRSVDPMGFDLMANSWKKGDRSRRDDDRYLFLEAIQSAGERLYISYCGHSIQDNSKRGASVLVNELLDYIQESFVLESDSSIGLIQSRENLLNHLITEHPLTAFSPSYFDSSSQLFSYQNTWLAANDDSIVQHDFFEQGLGPWDVSGELELEDFIRFMTHPCKYLLNKRLGIFFDEQSSELEESEPFSLDNLQKYQVKSQLFDNLLKDQKALGQDSLLAKGELPHGHFSTMILQEHGSVIAPLVDSFRHLLKDKSDVEVSIELDNIKIQGWINDIYSLQAIRFRAGKANTKYKLKCFIEFLCYCAVVDNPKPMRVFAEDVAFQFDTLTRASARQHLEQYCKLYLQGMQNPLAFFVRSSGKLIQEYNKKTNETDEVTEKAFGEFNKAFNGGYNITGEGSDAYIKRCFPEINEQIMTDVVDLAKEILLPMERQIGGSSVE